MAASEAAVTAVMEALGCKREVDRNGHAYCEAHWFGWLSDVDACPRAERAANAAVDADRASIQAEALREAAKAIHGDPAVQARHLTGGFVRGLRSATRLTSAWLRARADRIEARP